MLRAAKLGALLIMCSAFSLAYPGKPFDLRMLVERADIIAVVDISRIDDAGPTSADADGRPLLANAYRADAQVERRIKGACPDRLILDFFTPQQFVGFPGVAVGHQMVFVKRRGSSYEFADRHFPSLPATPGSVAEIEPDPLQAVIAELGLVVSSTGATQAQKWAVLARARGIPNVESFKLSLQAGLDAAENIDLKYRIQTELISRDDLSELRSSVNLLLSGNLTDEQQQRFLLVIANDVKNPTSVPEITRLLGSGNPPLRRTAAEALWHIASPGSIPELARALQDSDQEVRFYAVRALSDIANDPGWGGPGKSEFQARQQEYLTHWQNWVKGLAH